MFLVDANVLIEAKNRYYAFDIAPGFWAWLDQAHHDAVAAASEPYETSFSRAAMSSQIGRGRMLRSFAP